jgi:hypothetical protein
MLQIPSILVSKVIVPELLCDLVLFVMPLSPFFDSRYFHYIFGIALTTALVLLLAKKAFKDIVISLLSQCIVLVLEEYKNQHCSHLQIAPHSHRISTSR